MNGVPLRFMHQFGRQFESGQHFVVAMPKLLDAAEFHAIVQARRANGLVERLDGQRIVVEKLPPQIGERGERFLKSIVRRIDAT